MSEEFMVENWDDLAINVRDELPLLIDRFGLKSGVEIGVCEGAFSELLLTNSSLVKLYSIDAWTEDATQTMSSFKKCDVVDGKIERRYAMTKERLAKFGDRSTIIKATSIDALKEFEDNSLDFIYLDASHRFSGFALDMIYWWPKLRFGGIYAGHDFWTRYRYETAYVVNGFCVEMKQFFFLTTQEKSEHHPASWYLRKTQRDKATYFGNRDRHVEVLRKQAHEINRKKKWKVDLPYEYQ